MTKLSAEYLDFIARRGGADCVSLNTERRSQGKLGAATVRQEIEEGVLKDYKQIFTTEPEINALVATVQRIVDIRAQRQLYGHGMKRIAGLVGNGLQIDGIFKRNGIIDNRATRKTYTDSANQIIETLQLRPAIKTPFGGRS